MTTVNHWLKTERGSRTAGTLDWSNIRALMFQRPGNYSVKLALYCSARYNLYEENKHRKMTGVLSFMSSSLSLPTGNIQSQRVYGQLFSVIRLMRSVTGFL